MTKPPLTRLGELGTLGLSALRLGCTSFGGPIAHLAYFRREYVVHRQWIDEQRFADVVAVAQFLPGPTSSQVGMALGWLRSGWAGALVAWLGFTLPSALLMTLLAWLGSSLPSGVQPWFRGLPLVAVAVVAQAVWAMARQYLVDSRTTLAALLTVVFLALVPSETSPLPALLAVAVIGWFGFRPAPETLPKPAVLSGGWRLSLVPLSGFLLLLVALPLLSVGTGFPLAALADSFYRIGALVFGGGHVVLPLLQHEMAAHPGLAAQDLSLGYGWVQAMPGPLFSIAAYLGYLEGGFGGAALATVMIFLPAYLLVLGLMPLWEKVRSSPGLRGVLAAVNASVVGLLTWALYTPLWTGAVRAGPDFAVVLVLFLLAQRWNWPAWALVGLGLGAGALLQAGGLD